MHLPLAGTELLTTSIDIAATFLRALESRGDGERLPRHLDGSVALFDLTPGHHGAWENVEACNGCASPPWMWPGITTRVKGRRLRSVGIRTVTNSQRRAVG